MLRRLIVISGQVSSGKSTLAQRMSNRFDIDVRRTKNWLARRAGHKADLDRKDLQRYGDRLDRQTSGKWIVQELTRDLATRDSDTLILDAARTKNQVGELLRACGPPVTHL